MATTNIRATVRPAMDEWGVYDPEQAGLAALLRRLDTAAKPAVNDCVQATEQPAAAERPSLRGAK